MFIQANNTLISMADAQHTYDCLKELDFLVYMDVFMNPTAELADIVLPAALWPEVDCLFCMPEFADRVLLSQRKCVQVGECKSDEEFILELCRRAGWNYGFTAQKDMMNGQLQEMIRRRPELHDMTLERIQDQGYLEPERTYENYKTRGFQTPTGKFEFWSTARSRRGRIPPLLAGTAGNACIKSFPVGAISPDSHHRRTAAALFCLEQSANPLPSQAGAVPPCDHASRYRRAVWHFRGRLGLD